MSKNQVTLYALSTCGWCKKTHFFLEDHHIEHEVIMVDLLEPEEKVKAREKLGRFNPRKSFPTTVVDDKIGIPGFDEEKIRQALGLPPAETPESLMKRLKAEAEASGYYLNPDKKFVLTLMEGLLKNKSRYGYLSCPCMESYGTAKLDKDIVCPCDYRDSDLAEYGSCYCALYVSEDVAKGIKRAESIPLRRPSKEEMQKSSAPQKQGTANAKQVAGNEQTENISSRQGSQKINLSFPVWRCKVCGYLCGKEEPPLKCPVCGVDRDRFELFINSQ